MCDFNPCLVNPPYPICGSKIHSEYLIDNCLWSSFSWITTLDFNKNNVKMVVVCKGILIHSLLIITIKCKRLNYNMGRCDWEMQAHVTYFILFLKKGCAYLLVLKESTNFLFGQSYCFFFCPLFFLFEIKIFHICFWADLFKAFDFYLSLVQNMREIVPMSGRKEWTLELIYGGGSYSSSSSSSFSSFLFF